MNKKIQLIPLLAGATVLALAGCSTSDNGGPTSSASPSSVYKYQGTLLNGVNANATGAKFSIESLPTKAAGSTEGFDASQWKDWNDHILAKDQDWTNLPSNNCDAREATLIRDGKNVKYNKDTCEIQSGTWNDPYTGKVITDPTLMTADVILPAKVAYSYGANAWNEEQRVYFVNNPVSLVAASIEGVKAKNAQSIAQWRPEDPAAQCDYAIRWITAEKAVGLSHPDDVQAALEKSLASCSATSN